MAMMATHPDLDRSVPLSSILWTVFFWSCTTNCTILPDAFGSATFKCMLADVGLLGDVSMARQDSGRLERFAAIFPEVPKMASEIENFGDIEDALTHGYVAFGAGGFFGEKRRTAPELSIAGKITIAKSSSEDGSLAVGYAGKLGDFFRGSWATFDPSIDEAKAKAKFIVSAESDRDEMFARMVAWAAKGDKLLDDKADGHIVPAADAMALAATIRKMAEAPCMTGKLGDIRTRLLNYAQRIACAADHLQ